MAILAFDSCLRAISAAVCVDGRTIARFEPCETGHAERLLPLIQAVLKDAQIGFLDLTRLAVTLGPGGFTGLRVGLSAARGLALAMDISVVAVSSLELMAWEAAAHNFERAPEAERYLVVVPAGRGAVYVQEFRVTSDVGRPLAAALTSGQYLQPGSIACEIDLTGSIVAGPGAAELLALAPNSRPLASILPDLQPNAAYLAERASGLTPVAELRPIYLRAADAKPQISKALPRATA